MDASQYYVTTLSAAFKNLAPILIFLLGGYFIFIKLPFLFFLKSIKVQKKDFEQDQILPRQMDQQWKKDYKLADYEDFQRRMKILNTPKEDKKEEPKKEEAKKEDRRQHEGTKQKAEGSRQENKEVPKKAKGRDFSAEELFDLKMGEVFTKQELKKKYYELLKMNHPDKVASLGHDFKKLAELKTKEINSAYLKLKSRAA